MRVWSGQAGESPGRALLAGNGEAPCGGGAQRSDPLNPWGREQEVPRLPAGTPVGLVLWSSRGSARFWSGLAEVLGSSVPLQRVGCNGACSLGLQAELSGFSPAWVCLCASGSEGSLPLTTAKQGAPSRGWTQIHIYAYAM